MRSWYDEILLWFNTMKCYIPIAEQFNSHTQKLKRKKEQKKFVINRKKIIYEYIFSYHLEVHIKLYTSNIWNKTKEKVRNKKFQQ